MRYAHLLACRRTLIWVGIGAYHHFSNGDFLNTLSAFCNRFTLQLPRQLCRVKSENGRRNQGIGLSNNDYS